MRFYVFRQSGRYLSDFIMCPKRPKYISKNCRSKESQYQRDHIERELNKAFIGFYNEDEGDEPNCVATGNWGCGAFGGL